MVSKTHACTKQICDIILNIVPTCSYQLDHDSVGPRAGVTANNCRLCFHYKNRGDGILLQSSFAYRKSLKISDVNDIANTLFFQFSLLAEKIVAPCLGTFITLRFGDCITTLHACGLIIQSPPECIFSFSSTKTFTQSFNSFFQGPTKFLSKYFDIIR